MSTHLTPEIPREKRELIAAGAQQRQSIAIAIAESRAMLAPSAIWESISGGATQRVQSLAENYGGLVAEKAYPALITGMRSGLNVLRKPKIRRNLVAGIAVWRAALAIFQIMRSRRAHASAGELRN